MAAFYAGYLAVPGVYVPFFPVWLEYRGLSATEIAICLAVPYFARVLSTPAGGYFADRAPNRRFAIRIFIVVGVFWLFVNLPTNFWPILILTVLSHVRISRCRRGGADADRVRQFGLDYGRMRLYGSAAFIIVNLASGRCSPISSAGAIYWMLLALLLASAACRSRCR
jgi:PPP family 3-phenylpropionic acid transporter